MLESLDNRIECAPAPPHQHQHIAVAQRAALVARPGHGAGGNQRSDLRLDPPRQAYFGTRLRDMIERRTPAFHVIACVRHLDLPEIDQRRGCVLQRHMRRHAVEIGCDALVNAGILEGAGDRLQNTFAGPERIGERYGIETQPGCFESLLDVSSAMIEFARHGTLKREDRLLLIANRKDRALDAVARACAGGELGRQTIDDVPLSRASVLCLIDQNMIDAAVELEMNPARRHVGQHVIGLVDQVIVIEQAALLLLAPIVIRCSGRDYEQGEGTVAGPCCPQPCDKRRNAISLVTNLREQAWKVLAQAFAEQVAVFLGNAVLFQEELGIIVDCARPSAVDCGGEARCLSAVDVVCRFRQACD